MNHTVLRYDGINYPVVSGSAALHLRVNTDIPVGLTYDGSNHRIDIRYNESCSFGTRLETHTLPIPVFNVGANNIPYSAHRVM